MKYLGIDYGTKTIGTAISDNEGRMAFPYKNVKNDMMFLDAIHNICGEEEISGIVMGESMDLSGKPNKIMGSVEELVKNLEADLGLPVYLQKEFMTSSYSSTQATKDIYSERKIKKEKEVKDDRKAAVLILQRYLDKKNKNNDIV